MRTDGCIPRMILWCTLVIAGCVLVMLIANELFLQAGQGGFFNRGNQSVQPSPTLNRTSLLVSLGATPAQR